MSNTEQSLELNVILEQVKRYCSFSLGIQEIEELEPVYDPLIIRHRSRQLKEALECVIRFGPMPFGGIRDLTETLKNAAKGRVLTAGELVAEMELIRGIRGILHYEEALECEHAELHDIISTLTVHEKTEKYLSRCINEYGEVKDNASDELKGIRRQLQSADADIAAAVNRFMAAHSSSVVDSIVTYRNDRAVVLVKASDKNQFGGIIYGDSASGQASYVEPAAVVAANNRKQQLLSREQEEVQRILAACSAQVSAVAEAEMANLETCALLDSIFARAQWGKDRDAIAAVLTEEKCIDIKRARHPLIDPEKVVPNDYRLADPHRLLLITGPNTGGKTVSMKIIGLFVLMTYCGMPVTADEAVIPYFDHVFVDIGDDQSVVSSLSSFSAQIVKLAEVAEQATGDSLALLDEIGSGTDPREGESLAIAMLNELRSRGTMTVATTHYGRLKTYGKRHPDILLASVQFDMEKLTPTYRYLEGLTGQSNALEVAEKYGLPRGIIRYARFLKNQAKTSEDELLEKLERQLNENQQLQEKLEAQLAEAEKKNKQLEHEKRQLEYRREQLKDEASREAEEILEEARKKADKVLKELRTMRTAPYHEALAVRHELENSVKPAAEPETPAGDGDYTVHQAVELRSSGQVAEVTAVNKKNLTIRLNGREMKVSRDAVRPSLKVIARTAAPKPTVSFSAPAETVHLECNLIGMHVDEAMDTMAAYVDQAKIARLHTFRIIHGDGSGALRKAVHKALAADRDVKEFRLGMPNEGGTGATVVVLRD